MFKSFKPGYLKSESGETCCGAAHPRARGLGQEVGSHELAPEPPWHQLELGSRGLPVKPLPSAHPPYSTGTCTRYTWVAHSTHSQSRRIQVVRNVEHARIEHAFPLQWNVVRDFMWEFKWDFKWNVVKDFKLDFVWW